MGCLCCGAAADVGALCRRCAREVAPCDGLIPDHLRSTIDASGAEAWLIDGFGGAHAIGPQCRIGRTHAGDLVVLASSVSREHAVIARSGPRVIGPSGPASARGRPRVIDPSGPATR